jgi:hypothetical protein
MNKKHRRKKLMLLPAIVLLAGVIFATGVNL